MGEGTSDGPPLEGEIDSDSAIPDGILHRVRFTLRVFLPSFFFLFFFSSFPFG